MASSHISIEAELFSLLTVVASLEAAEDEKTLEVDPPQSLDLMLRRLDEIGDVARSDEQRLSIARNVDNAKLIFSSSNVISAFWKKITTLF